MGRSGGNTETPQWPGVEVLPGSQSTASTHQVSQERERPWRCPLSAGTAVEATRRRLGVRESERAHSTGDVGEPALRGPRGGRGRAVVWTRRRERWRGHSPPTTSHRDSSG